MSSSRSLLLLALQFHRSGSPPENWKVARLGTRQKMAKLLTDDLHTLLTSLSLSLCPWHRMTQLLEHLCSNNTWDIWQQTKRVWSNEAPLWRRLSGTKATMKHVSATIFSLRASTCVKSIVFNIYSIWPEEFIRWRKSDSAFTSWLVPADSHWKTLRVH